MGADILAKVERRWPKQHHELGPCLVWTGATSRDAEGPVRADVRRGDRQERLRPPRGLAAGVRADPGGDGLEVDELCEITLCERPDHLELMTKRDNVKRRGPTRGPKRRMQ